MFPSSSCFDMILDKGGWHHGHHVCMRSVLGSLSLFELILLNPPPLGDAHGKVPPHRDGHQDGHQSRYISHCCFVCCCPGGRRGDTELVVTRRRDPVASSVALDMLHWAMLHVSLQRLTMAIEMACMEGHSFTIAAYFACHNHS